MGREDEKDDTAPTARNLLDAFPEIGADRARELARKIEDLSGADDEDQAKYGERIDKLMEEASEILDGHGVEAIQAEDGTVVDGYWRETILLYVNQGETYETTLCYDTEEGEFFIGSWGDFIEDWEKEEEEEGDEESEEEEEEEEDEDAEDEDAEDEEAEEEEEVGENGE